MGLNVNECLFCVAVEVEPVRERDAGTGGGGVEGGKFPRIL